MGRAAIIANSMPVPADRHRGTRWRALVVLAPMPEIVGARRAVPSSCVLMSCAPEQIVRHSKSAASRPLRLCGES